MVPKKVLAVIQESSYNPNFNHKISYMKATVIIERGDDGTYSAYIADDNVPYGILGSAKTVQETIDDFRNSYEEMKAYYKEVNKKFTPLEVTFKYDMASFLAYYSNVLSLAGLERLTGINQGQLSHYVRGHRKPGKKTVEKIERKLHDFGKELYQLQFA